MYNFVLCLNLVRSLLFPTLSFFPAPPSHLTTYSCIVSHTATMPSSTTFKSAGVYLHPNHPLRRSQPGNNSWSARETVPAAAVNNIIATAQTTAPSPPPPPDDCRETISVTEIGGEPEPSDNETLLARKLASLGLHGAIGEPYPSEAEREDILEGVEEVTENHRCEWEQAIIAAKAGPWGTSNPTPSLKYEADPPEEDNEVANDSPQEPAKQQPSLWSIIELFEFWLNLRHRRLGRWPTHRTIKSNKEESSGKQEEQGQQAQQQPWASQGEQLPIKPYVSQRKSWLIEGPD